MSSRNGSVGEYVVTAKIGSGSFAVVYRGHHKTTHMPVAIKAINRERLNAKLQENLESEISILRNTHHPNIVQLYDIKKTEKHIYLIMEFCAGGDLQKFIRKNKALPEHTAQHFLKELANGLAFLWSRNLIHRDLKPQNLLLTSESPNAALKIADFGFARHLATASMAETLCGSPLYMAPEILRFQKYDAKADLWSVGTILFEMVVGRPPFGGSNHIQLLANIERNELRFPQDISVSEMCITLLQGLLRRNPMMRCSFEEFFGSPFVQIDMKQHLQSSPPQDTSSSMCSSDHGQVQVASSALSTATECQTMEEAKPTPAVVVTDFVRRHSTPANMGLNPTSDSCGDRQVPSRWSLPGNESSFVNGGTSTAVSPSPRTNPFKNLSESPPDTSSASHALSRPPRAPASSPTLTSTVGRDVSKFSAARVDADEYILVDNIDNSGSRNGHTTIMTTKHRNNISIAETVSYVEIVGRRAQAIAQLGDRIALAAVASTSPGSSVELSGSMGDGGMGSVSNASSSCRNLYGDALIIYLKSLEVFYHAIQVTRSALEGANRRRVQVEGDVQPQRLSMAFTWLSDQLNRCLERAEQCKKRVTADSKVPTPSVQELLYTNAMQLGCEGAVKEVLGQKPRGQELYMQAQLLLETILMDPVVGDADRSLLISYIKGLSNRVEANLMET